MRNKSCPYCFQKLGFIELLLLDPHTPKKCKNCGKYLKTSFVNLIVSAVVPVIMCVAAIYLFDLDLVISLSLLLLIPVLLIVLAEPLKYTLSSNGNACLQCKRTNIGFSFPNSKICDKCFLKGKKQSDLQPR